MKLRKLLKKDAPFMHEWMHDKSVVENLRRNFASNTVADCEKFILSASDDTKNLHLAIVSDDDEYMGTVSLKNINNEEKYAEFAITVRSAAMGKGYSKYAMSEIIRIGFEEIGLEKIYWDVSVKNKRAIRFYEKMGGKTVDSESVPSILREGYENMSDEIMWYVTEGLLKQKEV